MSEATLDFMRIRRACEQLELETSEQRRQDVIGAIRALKLDSQMPEGWEEKIAADHVIVLPEEMQDKTPDASQLPFIRFDKHLPAGRCLIVKLEED